MERDAEIEREFVRQVASKVRDKEFIIAALHQMSTNKERRELIEYLKENQADKEQIKRKMFSIIAEEQNDKG